MTKDLVTIESKTRSPLYTSNNGKKILITPMGLTRVPRKLAENLIKGYPAAYVIVEDRIRKAQAELDEREAKLKAIEVKTEEPKEEEKKKAVKEKK
jgi:hypothetical protein